MKIDKINHFIEKKSIIIPLITLGIYFCLKIPKFNMISNLIDQNILCFLSSTDKLNILVSICGILIGFFITSFSIILSSEKTMINLVKGELGTTFVRYFSAALIINFIHIIVLLIYDINIINNIKIPTIICSFMFHFILSFRFIYSIINIFNKNIGIIEKDLEQEERKLENEKFLAQQNKLDR